MLPRRSYTVYRLRNTIHAPTDCITIFPYLSYRKSPLHYLKINVFVFGEGRFSLSQLRLAHFIFDAPPILIFVIANARVLHQLTSTNALSILFHSHLPSRIKENVIRRIQTKIQEFNKCYFVGYFQI